MRGDLPEYLYIIAACMVLLLILALTLAFLDSFIQLKKTLIETTSSEVSNKVQIVFLVLISCLAILQMVMAFFYYYNFSDVFLLVDLICLIARICVFMCLAY